MILGMMWGARALAGLGGWSNPNLDLDGDGIVRLTWRKDDRTIAAVFPPPGNHHRYLYYKWGTEHRAIPDFEIATIAERLNWLSRRHAITL